MELKMNILLFLLLPVFVIGKKPLNVKYLELDSTFDFVTKHRTGFYSSDLQIYCYEGRPKSLVYTFQTINLDLEIKNDDFVEYDGGTPEEVYSHYESQRSIFSWTHLLTQYKKKQVRMNPFNQTCVGVETAHPYRIHLRTIRIDFWKVLQMIIGVVVFLSAHRLSTAPVFYYLGGTMMGIIFSVFLIVWFAGKILPKKSMMYGTIAGGWIVGMYFLQMIWDNARILIVTHQVYVIYYITISGLISFLFCYRIGPPVNQRSIDIIKWILQLISTGLTFYSSEYREVTVAIIVVLFFWYYVPKSWFFSIRGYWRKKFPPAVKLLSKEEFERQGEIETKKALEELKEYCQSPKVQAWRVVSSLNNPKRFAEFIEGDSHLRNSEVEEHETTFNDDFVDDYDDDDNDNDEDDCDNEVNDQVISDDENSDDNDENVPISSSANIPSPAFTRQLNRNAQYESKLIKKQNGQSRKNHQNGRNTPNGHSTPNQQQYVTTTRRKTPQPTRYAQVEISDDE